MTGPDESISHKHVGQPAADDRFATRAIVRARTRFDVRTCLSARGPAVPLCEETEHAPVEVLATSQLIVLVKAERATRELAHSCFVAVWELSGGLPLWVGAGPKQKCWRAPFPAPRRLQVRERSTER